MVFNTQNIVVKIEPNNNNSSNYIYLYVPFEVREMRVCVYGNGLTYTSDGCAYVSGLDISPLCFVFHTQPIVHYFKTPIHINGSYKFKLSSASYPNVVITDPRVYFMLRFEFS